MLERRWTLFGKSYVPLSIRICGRKLVWRFRYLLQAWTDPANNHRITCPISKRTFKRYIKDRDLLLSPDSGARNRHRLVWLYLNNETGIFTDPVRVLHIAPEYSYFKILNKMTNMEYYPGDKLTDSFNFLSGLLNIDLLDVRFPDNYFEYIICMQVLEHIPDDIRAMSEMYRVLKPGGSAIITVPIDKSRLITYENQSVTTPKARAREFGHWDHVRWYAPDIKDRLSSAGFQIDMIEYGRNFSRSDYLRFGLNDDLIIVGRKFVEQNN